MSIRHLKKLTQTAETQYAAAVSLEHNPATFGDAVIDISNSLNAQSANAFEAVKRAFPSAFMDATLGADPAGIRQLPDNLVHLASKSASSASPTCLRLPLRRSERRSRARSHGRLMSPRVLSKALGFRPQGSSRW